MLTGIGLASAVMDQVEVTDLEADRAALARTGLEAEPDDQHVELGHDSHAQQPGAASLVGVGA